VRNDATRHRFELCQDGHLAVAHYRIQPGVITFTHTEMPTELAGRGVGSRLIVGALYEVRRQGLKVVTECPFVGSFIAKHPAYGDLLAGGPAARGPEPKPDGKAKQAPSDKKHLDELLDEALKESFPASDPAAIDVKS
jgi:predicted GNAT family acetyltransferase